MVIWLIYLQNGARGAVGFSLGKHPHLLECVFTRPDHRLGRIHRIVNIRELTALKGESSRPDALVTRIEVRVLLVLHEISNEELAPMSELCSAESLHGSGALAAIPDLEEATVACFTRTSHLSVIDKIDRMADSIVAAHVSIDMAALVRALTLRVSLLPYHFHLSLLERCKPTLLLQ